MDVIFDIDGTLANAEHRLHFIIPPVVNSLFDKEGIQQRSEFQKDWDSFLADEHVSKDTAIPQTWEILESLLIANNKVIFITGRPERQRQCTVDWLMRHIAWEHATPVAISGYLYMRQDGDRRPSHVVKEESLQRARAVGYSPTLVFEDRADDTAMWRRNGLLCCQVAEGNY